MPKGLTIMILLLFLTAAYAEENQVRLGHVGYGTDPTQVKISVHNIGDNTLNALMFYVDGEFVRARDTILEPNKGIGTSFNLEPGDHLIEVRTSEGAYDSLQVTVSPVAQKGTITQQEGIALTDTIAFKVVIIFAIITVVGIWLSMKKSRLDL